MNKFGIFPAGKYSSFASVSLLANPIESKIKIAIVNTSKVSTKNIADLFFSKHVPAVTIVGDDKKFNFHKKNEMGVRHLLTEIFEALEESDVEVAIIPDSDVFLTYKKMKNLSSSIEVVHNDKEAVRECKKQYCSPFIFLGASKKVNKAFGSYFRSHGLPAILPSQTNQEKLQQISEMLAQQEIDQVPRIGYIDTIWDMQPAEKKLEKIVNEVAKPNITFLTDCPHIHNMLHENSQIRLLDMHQILANAALKRLNDESKEDRLSLFSNKYFFKKGSFTLDDGFSSDED